MDFKLFLTVFLTVFLAELGDKTQLATLLFSSREAGKLTTIFIAASLALVLTTALGVAAGAYLATYVNSRYLSYVAGMGFLLIGAWTIWQAST